MGKSSPEGSKRLYELAKIKNEKLKIMTEKIYGPLQKNSARSDTKRLKKLA